MNIFVAEIETPNTSSHGYGETPQQALEVLLRRWRVDYAPAYRADPDYLEEFREEITVFEVEVGKGYVISSGDELARPVVALGSNPMFDTIFESFRSGPAP